MIEIEKMTIRQDKPKHEHIILPQGWEIKKLSEVCDKASSNISQNQLTNENGTYPIYGASGFIKNISFYHRKQDYISIVKDGAGIGRITLLKAYSSVIGTLQYLIPKDELNIDYFYYFLSSVDFLKYKNGSTIPHIYFKDYSEELILIPPLPEQKRIKVILDEALSHLIKAKSIAEQNLKNTKELFENYLATIFENKVEGWELIALGDIATFRNGMNFTKGSKGEEIKIVGVKDFQKRFWVPFENLESVTIDGTLNEIDFLKEDDILTVRSNGNPELIGRTLLAGNVTGKVSHSGFTIRIRLDTKNVLPLYLCHYLKTKKARKELVESGTGVNIKSLNQVALSSLQISFPKSISEQIAIIQKLDELSLECKKLESIYQKKIIALDELKKSILQKAFSGQLK